MDSKYISATHGQYEDLALAIISLIDKAMDKQPPEVAAELWKMHMEDLKNWRAFWEKFGAVFKDPEGKPKS